MKPALIYLWPDRVLTFFEGFGGRYRIHHYSPLLVVSKDTLQVCSEITVTVAKAVVLPANVPVTIEVSNKLIASMSLDNAGQEVTALAGEFEFTGRDRFFVSDDKRLVESLFAIESQTPDIRLATWQVFNLIYGTRPVTLKKFDKRILKAVSLVFQRPQDNISISTLAHHVHLSESRFAHLFKDSVGTSFNRFKVGLRLIHFLERYSLSGDITQSCEESGFHDLSHFYKTYRAAFGVMPSKVFSSKNPPTIISDQERGLGWYGCWLANHYQQLSAEHEEMPFMVLLEQMLAAN